MQWLRESFVPVDAEFPRLSQASTRRSRNYYITEPRASAVSRDSYLQPVAFDGPRETDRLVTANGEEGVQLHRDGNAHFRARNPAANQPLTPPIEEEMTTPIEESHEGRQRRT